MRVSQILLGVAFGASLAYSIPGVAYLFGPDPQDMKGIWIFDEPKTRAAMSEHYDDWILKIGFREVQSSVYVFDPEEAIMVFLEDRDTAKAICNYDLSKAGQLTLTECLDQDGNGVESGKFGKIQLWKDMLVVSDGRSFVHYFRHVSERTGK